MSSVCVWWPWFDLSSWAWGVVRKCVVVLARLLHRYGVGTRFVIRFERPDVDFGLSTPNWRLDLSAGWNVGKVRVDSVPDKKAFIALGAVWKESMNVTRVVIKNAKTGEIIRDWNLDQLMASGMRVSMIVDVDPPIFMPGDSFQLDIYSESSVTGEDTEYIFLVFEETGRTYGIDFVKPSKFLAMTFTN